jgi:hypothetical protein
MILLPKKCLICGAEFVPKKHANQKYCSPECAKEAEMRKRAEGEHRRKGSTVTRKALKKYDPYAWLHEFNDYIRRNGGSPHYHN